MTSKAKGSSIRQKLVNLSIGLGLPYQNVETSFILERLVARLTADEILREHLVFKGGFVGLRVYESARYTVDIDALVVKANIEEILGLAKTSTERDLDDGVWFRFESQLELATQGEYGGVRQSYRAGIGEVLKKLEKARIVHFDVGIGDPVTPRPFDLDTPSLINSESSLSWRVYPVETIIAEKLHALIAHGDLNSRSKDVYDLKTLLQRANAETLATALKRCFAFRQTELPDSFATFLRSIDTSSLQRGWTSATASVVDKVPFDIAFAEVVNQLEHLERLFSD